MEIGQTIKLKQDGFTRYRTYDTATRNTIEITYNDYISGIISHIPSSLRELHNDDNFIDIVMQNGKEIVIRIDWIQELPGR